MAVSLLSSWVALPVDVEFRDALVDCSPTCVEILAVLGLLLLLLLFEIRSALLPVLFGHFEIGCALWHLPDAHISTSIKAFIVLLLADGRGDVADLGLVPSPGNPDLR